MKVNLEIIFKDSDDDFYFDLEDAPSQNKNPHRNPR